MPKLDHPIDVIPVAPGYVDTGNHFPRPVIAIGRNSHREYQACILDRKGALVFVERVQPADEADF